MPDSAVLVEQDRSTLGLQRQLGFTVNQFFDQKQGEDMFIAYVHAQWCSSSVLVLLCPQQLQARLL